MAMLDCNYLIFDKPDQSFPCNKQWLIDVHGFGDDPQYSDHGRVVWDSGDSFNIIFPEIVSQFPERKKTA